MDQKSKQRKNGQSEDKETLKEYLNQYYTGRIKRSQLERRLKNIRAEMDAPIGGYGYSPVNYGGTNKVGSGAASFVYRMSEIETRIEDQKSRVEKALLKVMDIMDFWRKYGGIIWGYHRGAIFQTSFLYSLKIWRTFL